MPSADLTLRLTLSIGVIFTGTIDHIVYLNGNIDPEDCPGIVAQLIAQNEGWA